MAKDLFYRIVFVTVVFFIFIFTPSRTAEISVDTASFIENACISYKTEFTFDTTLERFHRMMSNILLMGRLWEIYGFDPPYKINLNKSGFHIIDPTGIEGDLIELSPDGTVRVFFAKGTLNHWGLPLNLRGKALFLVEHFPTDDGITVNLRIYGEGGDNFIMDILLKACSPILRRLINKRITHNVRDLQLIISDIEHQPDKVRKLLDGHFLNDFNLLTGFRISDQSKS